MNRKILVVGSLNMDMVIEMKKMPLIGETILGHSLAYVPGGKGGNQAYAIGNLGGSAAILGCVGTDAFGRKLIKSIKSSGVDVTYVDACDIPTGTAIIHVDEQGNNSIVVVPGANKACDVEFLKRNEKLFQVSDFIVFQMEIPSDAVFYGICKAKEYGKTVILNPAPAPDNLPDDILSKIDYLTPNEREILKLCGETDLSMEQLEKCARRLVDKGVKNVLVTLGDKGVLFVNNNQKRLFEARKVAAVDTTAAGDCFNGAFVAAMAEGMKVCEAIEFANLASSLAVQKKGAQASIPKREEVDALMKTVSASA